MRVSKLSTIPLFLLLGLAYPMIILSQSMSNDGYMIQTEDINTEYENLQEQKNINQQTEKGQPEEKGFEDDSHTNSQKLFVFSIPQTLIYYGPLTPTDPITRTIKLTVFPGPTQLFSIIAFEDRELSGMIESLEASPGASKNEEPISIPDTSCDNGLCSESIASAWTSNLTYGFGYRCDNISGSACRMDFNDSSFFKHFANESNRESPQYVLKGKNQGGDAISEITFKLNISGSQPKSTYTNRINFIAIPNY